MNGTDAPLLADDAVTDDGPLMAAEGAGETLTGCEVVAPQLPLLTETL